MSDTAYQELRDRIKDHTAVLGVIGLGYVGLPLAVEMARSGYRTLGFDVSERVVAGVNRGESHIQDIASDVLAAYVGEGLLSATTDLSRLSECDAISICVPTPLSKTKDPDLSFVVSATRAVADALRPGQVIILESTTYPGTTREAMLPVFEQKGLSVGEDFFLCFSPERVDPGNPVWHTRNTPKVLGGLTPACTEVGLALYDQIFETVVPVSSSEAAELVKLYENTFRMINIALVNEMAQVCDRLGVDVWEVIEAAATKPFGFMKFTPGPGLGGHCIPLDPHYLSWKMRTLSFKTRMIELSSEINAEMPQFVVKKVGDALNDAKKAINGSRVLVLGVAYKKDIDDLRESPSLEVLHLLQEKGAEVAYHDPFCATIKDDGHTPLEGLPMHSVELTTERLQESDCVVIVTDHSEVDYAFVAEHAPLIVDTRGIMRRVHGRAKVIGLSGVEIDGPKRGTLQAVH
ncbi:MAG TPA: nucleotide sugar dehydrogenase [Longimicrobiaceae bacterium]|nr:nucleotide sugar dehydrogenase [Longimicrobiaceae bacterium]